MVAIIGIIAFVVVIVVVWLVVKVFKSTLRGSKNIGLAVVLLILLIILVPVLLILVGSYVGNENNVGSGWSEYEYVESEE